MFDMIYFNEGHYWIIGSGSMATVDKENIQGPFANSSEYSAGVVAKVKRRPFGNLSNTPTKLVKTKHFIDLSSPKVIPVSLCANSIDFFAFQATCKINIHSCSFSFFCI
jgi:hypothetical protein